MMLLIGGEVYPVTKDETIWAITLELIGVITTTIVFSNILLVIDLATSRNTKVNKQLDVFNQVYDFLDLPSGLISEINDYILKSEWAIADRDETVGFIEELP